MRNHVVRFPHSFFVQHSTFSYSSLSLNLQIRITLSSLSHFYLLCIQIHSLLVVLTGILHDLPYILFPAITLFLTQFFRSSDANNAHVHFFILHLHKKVPSVYYYYHCVLSLMFS
jgi:hypothetical protein